MRALFVDANDTLAAVTETLLRTAQVPVEVNRNPGVTPDDLPRLLAGFEIAIIQPRLRGGYIDYGSSSSSDYGGVGRAGLNYVL